MRPLSKASAGSDYTINWLMGLPETLNFFRKKDICEGSILHVVCSYSGSVLISCKGKRFILGDEVAERIQVTPCA